jgi:hypothetical protein
MATKLEFPDTFSQWKDKINALIDEFDQFIIDEVTPGTFGYDSALTSGLNVTITSGKIRDGSVVETVASDVVTLLPSTTNIVVVYKRTGDVPVFQVYDIANIPEQYVLPIAQFTTDATSVTGYTDLRTEFNTASGSTSSASGVLIFDALIDRDTEVPTGKNALSVAPTVVDGVTVTVADGSEWVVL